MKIVKLRILKMHLEDKIKSTEERIKELNMLIVEWKKLIEAKKNATS